MFDFSDAGRLPLDEVTKRHLHNPTALALHANGTNARVIGYSGNCSCTDSYHHFNPRLIVPGTCSLASPTVGEPCVVTWAAEVAATPDVSGGGATDGESTSTAPWVVVMIINMADSNATTHTNISRVGAESDVLYWATDVWTGAALAASPLVGASGVLSLTLRPHSSVLWRLTQLSTLNAQGVPPPALDSRGACQGEYSFCNATGSCTLNDCSSCAKGQYRCPLPDLSHNPAWATCVDGAAGYLSCPNMTGTHFDWNLSEAKRLDYLVQHMTLEEQAAQLTAGAPALERMGIPSYNWLDDDVHGTATGDGTIFPNGVTLGMSWDRDLLHRVGRAIGMEARGGHNGFVHGGNRGPGMCACFSSASVVHATFSSPAYTRSFFLRYQQRRRHHTLRPKHKLGSRPEMGTGAGGVL